jgi:hypothetical protein
MLPSRTLGRLGLIVSLEIGRSERFRDSEPFTGCWDAAPETDFQDFNIDLRTLVFSGGWAGALGTRVAGDVGREPDSDGLDGCHGYVDS